jgi:diguanylate cyclase (GGDEF)-like protein/PAS domain S-box-containing protein
MALLIVVYYAVPAAHVELWALIAASGVTAVVAGIVVNRPARMAPWILLALAVTCSAVGQVSQRAVVHAAHELVGLPSFADALFLAEYPVYVASLLLFIRASGRARDRRNQVDALIITIGLALLAWLFLIRPYQSASAESVLYKSVAIAYPIGNVLVLGVLAWLLAPGTTRGWPAALLAVGTVGGLLSDVALSLIHIHAGFGHPLTAVSVGWMAYYVALGSAALHPAMRDLTISRATRHQSPMLPRYSRARLVTLMIAALIPPIALFFRSFFPDRDSVERIVAATCMVLFVLVLSRLADANASHRRGLSRERTLRVAGAALAAAASVEEVGGAVQVAVRGLIGPKPGREALFAVREGESLNVIATASGDLSPGNEIVDVATGWMPRLREYTSPEPRVILPEGMLPETLPVATRRGWEGALICPLTLQDPKDASGARDPGDPSDPSDPLTGVLALFGDLRFLHGIAAALGILASQAALALERIMLSQKVIQQRGEALFRTLVQDASDVILVLDEATGTIRYATPSATELLGLGIEGERPVTLTTFYERIAAPRVRDPATGEMTDDQFGGLWRVRRRDGREVLVDVRHTDLRDDPTVGGHVLTIRDVTEQRKLEEELKHQAFHDALTGLPNRALFANLAAHGLALARRTGTTAAVLFIDLDDFKIVNDTMGHAIGDELLSGVAKRLASVARESDTAARLGGDEFALLVEGLPGPGDVDAFASRVVATFSEPFDLSAGSVLATATVGVSTTEDSNDVDELLRHADLSLYAAKSDGKRQWHRYAPVLSAGMVKRRQLQAALEDAVARSDFALAYQPIVSLANGEIRGFEALARWPDPPNGPVPPSEFIELAEETGLIIPLGSWVLRQAITDLARWRGPDPDPRQPGVSVNVSARQFRDPDFVARVRRYLHETGLVPNAIVLELTESALLRRDDRINSDLAELKRMGVRLAIDDFGTGYSSLSYLRDLPIDVLKIDKSFVDAITESAQGRRFAELIIDFALALDIRVIAEGIETEEQRSLLASMGCTYGQGYLLAMPMTWRDAEALLRTAGPYAHDPRRPGPTR